MRFLILLIFSFSINAQTISEVNQGEIISASKFNELVQRLNNKIEGSVSFGGATDGSVCDITNCEKYRAFGDLAGGMSATREREGTYLITVTGLKPNSFASCERVSAQVATNSERDTYQGTDYATNGSGSITFRVLTGVDDVASAVNRDDTYFHLNCKGYRP